MSEEHVLLEIKELLSDLIYVNGVIATELIRITENTAATRHGEAFLNKSTCIPEHNQLNKRIISIVKKYNKNLEDTASLEKHVLKHLE